MMIEANAQSSLYTWMGGTCTVHWSLAVFNYNKILQLNFFFISYHYIIACWMECCIIFIVIFSANVKINVNHSIDNYERGLKKTSIIYRVSIVYKTQSNKLKTIWIFL